MTTKRRFAPFDGIRAFAVLAVMLYHGGVPWAGGGLLGVDVFFVLSGFLITSLLCRELASTATVRLGQFWARRARRLLPALVVCLVLVAVYAKAFASSIDLTSVRGDALSALLYVSNWHFVLSDQGYFAQAAAPSPLLHTWSLAVEEQYYLIWPIVVLVVARLWGARKVALVAALGTVASAVAMVSLLHAGVSLDRLYYGTDTRAQALLVGSFLGAIGTHEGGGFAVVPDRWTAGRWARRLWVVPGVCGAAFLVWAWHGLGGQDPFLYQGGFLLVGVATGAVLLTCVTCPGSWLAGLCSFTPLVLVGRISYGLYLYHWPLFLIIDHAHTGLAGAGLLAARLAATFALATVSFVLVEEPIRRGRLAPLFRGWPGLARGVAALAATGAVVVATTVAPAAPTSPRLAGGVGLTASERHLLSAAGAFTTDPVRFLLVGDSIALTLGSGLSVHDVGRYGVKVVDRGTLGCDLDDTEVQLSGGVGPATPGCVGWRQAWPKVVARVRPQVVGLLIGRWETSDHLFHGRWVHVGEPGWDAHLVSELDQAVDILSAQGAKVVLFTTPYVDPPVEAADGTPFPENDPARTAAFNRLVVQVAHERPGVVTLVDLNRLIDPAGHYQATMDGAVVRWTDGIHISVAGGELIAPEILPTVARLGLAARSNDNPTGTR